MREAFSFQPLRTGTSGWITVVIVHSLTLRLLLRFEWAALPIGIGLSLDVPILCFYPREMPWWYPIVMAAIAVSFLAVGIWRPWHRRLGLPRNAIWTAP